MRALNKDSKEVMILPHTQCNLSFITCLLFRQQRQARVNIPGNSGKLCCGDLVQLEGEQVIKEINNSKLMNCCQAGFRNAFIFIQSTRNICSIYLP